MPATAFDDLPEVGSSPFDDLPEAKGPFDDLPNLTEAAPFRGFARGWTQSAGNMLKGVATASTPLTGAGMTMPMNAPPEAQELYGQALQQETEQDAARTPGARALAHRKQIQGNPLYQLGQTAVEGAPRLTPTQERSKLTRVGEMAGGFAPAVLGPAAPLAMGAQSIGEHITSDYDRMLEGAKTAGISDQTAQEIAAKGAIDKAFTSGAIQTGIFAVMPPVLRGALEKYLVDKFGKEWLSRYLLGRVAAGTEGATLGASSRAGENLVEGEPVLQGSGESAQGLAALNLLLPWLRGGKPSSARPLGEAMLESTPETPPAAAAKPIDLNKDVVADLIDSLTKGQIVKPPEAKEPEHAVQIGEPTPVPVAEPAGHSAEMGERIPEPETTTETPGQTAEAEATAPPAVAPEFEDLPETPGKKRSPIWIRPRSDGVPDILDHIQELGGLKPPGPEAGGEYDGWKEAMQGTAKMLAKKSATHTPDTIINELHSMGNGLKIESPDDLFSAIKSATRDRQTLTQTGGGHEAQTQRFWEAVNSPGNTAGLEKISVQDLAVGDTFRIRGPGISHEELTVTHLDPDTGAIQVKDGPKLGVQDIPDGAELWVQRGSKEAPPKSFATNRQGKPRRHSSTYGPREEPPLFGAKQQLGTIGTMVYPGTEGHVLSKMEQATKGRGLAYEVRQRLARGEPPAGSEAGFLRIPTREEFLEKLGEIPDRVYALYKHLDDVRQRMVNRYQRGGVYDLISKSFDANNTRAKLAGKQASNIILHELNRAFDVAPRKVRWQRNAERELGLTFAVEAGGQRSELGRMRAELTGNEAPAGVQRLWKRRALKAIDFAEANWDRLQPLTELYKRITDAENDYENMHGINTLYRRGGYVFHAHDVDESFGVLSTGTVGTQAGAPGPFLKQREYNTYADAIAAGKSPISLNAVDLLQKRMELGQRLVNHGEWIDGLAQVTDPVSAEQLISEPEIRTRADGQSYETVPPNYELIDFGGRHVALHKGYTGLFGDLTNKSVFEKGPIREAIMQGVGLAKHSMLLFDTYHFGRLAFWNAVTRLGGPTSARGVTLLDNTTPEIRRMIERGELPEKWGEQLLEHKQILDRLIKQGLNVGSVGDNLHTDFLQTLPGIGSFNKWLFERYQRGAMAEVGLLEYERQGRMFAGDSPDQLARRVAKDVNVRFGNLQSQGFFKNKTFQDLARIIFLAPQWNESLIRAELGAAKQFASGTVQSIQSGRIVMGGLARGIGTALLGIFVGNQLINYATRGKPTWENEEEGLGSKISAWIPDYAGGGPGFFLNPMSVPAEVLNLLYRGTDRHGGDWATAGRDFMAGRFSALSKGVYTFFTGETPMGQKLKAGAGNRIAGTLEQMAPMPISGGAIYRAGKQMVTGEHQEKYPGEIQKSAMQSFGVKTEQAPNAERRIRDLAVRFQRTSGIAEQPPQEPSIYQELTAALRRGNVTDANEAVDKVLQTAKNNGEPHTLKDIEEYYRNWAKRRFTLNKRLEEKFFAGLTPAQQDVYRKAYQDRATVAQKVGELLAKKEQQQGAAHPAFAE